MGPNSFRNISSKLNSCYEIRHFLNSITLRCMQSNMSIIEEETISILVSPADYAYHVDQIASFGTHHIRILRKQFSIKTPYTLETMPIINCSKVHYTAGLSVFHIGAGVLLTTMMLGIFYYLVVYWSRLAPGMTIQVGLLLLAFIYGLKWAFMSRRHKLVLHLRDGTNLKWQSRSGEFRYKQRTISNVLLHLRSRGLIAVES